MDLYTYDIQTGEYTGIVTAQKRPNGEFITEVLGATTVTPPEIPDGYAAVWRVEGWSLVEDHRQKYDATGVKTGGTPYWLNDDTFETAARYMTELGPLPEEALLVQPEKPEPTTEELAELVRTERDTRITACDWVISRHAEQVALGVDTTLTSEEYAAWLGYRQELRDLPSLEGFPWDGGGADDAECPWPSEPDGDTDDAAVTDVVDEVAESVS